MVREEQDGSRYRLAVAGDVTARVGGEWQSEIPINGLVGKLILVGNCGEREFKLRAFREPHIELKIEGEGVTDDEGEGWSLGTEGPQQLTLTVRPTNCILAIQNIESERQDQLLAADSAFVELVQTSLTNGARLDPGNIGVIPFSFDAKGWEEGEPHPLWFRASWAALPDGSCTRELLFRRQAQGILRIGEGVENWNPLSEIYVGFTAGGSDGDYPIEPLTFRNSGSSVITLRPPTIIHAFPALTNVAHWIELDWERWNPETRKMERIPRGRDLTLDVGAHGQFLLTLDFTGPLFANPPVLPHAEIEIFIEEQKRSIVLPILLPELHEPPLLQSVLAIDFGNTNTYAAYVASSTMGDDGRPRRTVVRVPLRDGDLEHNPTALFFKDENDPSKVLIGIEALAQGAARGFALFQGLKRSLVQPEELEKVEQIADRSAGRATGVTKRKLILLYLEHILKKCERKLKRRVVHVCFSHPANYGSRSRKAFDAIIAELERDWKKRHSAIENEITFEKLAIDEASAVCLQFVLDKTAYEEHIQTRVGPEPGERFFVASIDVGGGSTDLCLAEFTVTEPTWQTYQSQLHGIGGHETLGGDNFTVAVFEILKDKLLRLIESSGYSFPLAPLDHDRPVGDRLPWSNTRALWNLAEEVKKLVFRPVWDPHKAKLAADTFLSLARLIPQGGAGNPTDWCDVPELRTKFESAFPADNKGWITDDAIYDHVIQNDLNGLGGYSLRNRLKRCLDNLRKYHVWRLELKTQNLRKSFSCYWLAPARECP